MGLLNTEYEVANPDIVFFELYNGKRFSSLKSSITSVRELENGTYAIHYTKFQNTMEYEIDYVAIVKGEYFHILEDLGWIRPTKESQKLRDIKSLTFIKESIELAISSINHRLQEIWKIFPPTIAADPEMGLKLLEESSTLVRDVSRFETTFHFVKQELAKLEN
jgi:hypothetical protein